MVFRSFPTHNVVGVQWGGEEIISFQASMLTGNGGSATLLDRDFNILGDAFVENEVIYNTVGDIIVLEDHKPATGPILFYMDILGEVATMSIRALIFNKEEDFGIQPNAPLAIRNYLSGATFGPSGPLFRMRLSINKDTFDPTDGNQAWANIGTP